MFVELQDCHSQKNTNKFDGATLEDAIEDVSVMEISDKVQKRK